jgi:hypothetical protein
VIGLVVVAYRYFPEPLFKSILSSNKKVRWYIFCHGQNVELRRKLREFSSTVDAVCFDHGVNRGTARSFNDGLIASQADNNVATLFLNDDLHFLPGAFDQFVDFILDEGGRNPDAGLIMTYGTDTGGTVGSGEWHGKPVMQGLACGAVTAAAIEKVGYFDQNFWPVWYDDNDYGRRLKLSGLSFLIDERVHVEHKRSSTARGDRFLRRISREREVRNAAYYARKWGGPPGEETFTSAFGDPKLGCYISADDRNNPYGADHDRVDLGQAGSMGYLENDLIEELLASLSRHAPGAKRILLWGNPGLRETVAAYTNLLGADMVLSIEDEQAPAELDGAKYPFLHIRTISPDEAEGTGPTYSGYPLEMNLKFDAAIIMGRRRADCSVAAWHVLSPNGVALFFDEPLKQMGRRKVVGELFDTLEEGHHFQILRRRADGAAVMERELPTGRKALIVPIQGPLAEAEIAIARPLFEQYAQDVGADLRIVPFGNEVPAALVRAHLLPVAREYDRFAILDPHLIVRRGCPDLFDLVPEGELGALFEDNPSAHWERLSEAYGLSELPKQYINSSVLVMGSVHLALLEQMLQGSVLVLERGEQDHLNVLVNRGELTLRPLAREFNWIPLSDSEFDWQRAWILNIGHLRRPESKQQMGWRLLEYGGTRTYERLPSMQRMSRTASLIEVTTQMRGEDVRVYRPSDMNYHGPVARILVSSVGLATMWSERSTYQSFAISGPYAMLPAGLWQISFLMEDGKTPADERIVADVVDQGGNLYIRQAAPIGPGATITVELFEAALNFEVRLYSTGHDYSVGMIRMHALPMPNVYS